MDIPRRLRQRPRFRGMPIPFTTFVGQDGQPDFKVIDTNAVQSCYRRRLCALCGQDLPKQIVFIGGPLSADHRCFIDPAMHEECALYAASVCPYLVNPNGDYSQAPAKHRDDQDVKFMRHQVAPGRPARMALYYCNGYDVIAQMQDGQLVVLVKAWPATKIDWDIIPKTS